MIFFRRTVQDRQTFDSSLPAHPAASARVQQGQCPHGGARRKLGESFNTTEVVACSSNGAKSSFKEHRWLDKMDSFDSKMRCDTIECRGPGSKAQSVGCSCAREHARLRVWRGSWGFANAPSSLQARDPSISSQFGLSWTGTFLID
jgi:hypothetical protein